MTIELSKNEIELLDLALTSWEHEDMGNAMMSSMIGAVFSPKEAREDFKADMHREIAEAKDKGQLAGRSKWLVFSFQFWSMENTPLLCHD